MTNHHKNPNETKEYSVLYGSNSIRLSGSEWIAVTILCIGFFFFAPTFWGHIEQFKAGPDYRLPYALGSDYWLYHRNCQRACSEVKSLVVGDSVIWGHYVSKENTLASDLNKIIGRNEFANLGVDGFHPAALLGLLKYYGRNIKGKNVLIQLNPLWMSSQKHDLQTDKEFRFNHPKLVPQFDPKIPCYKDSFSKRLLIAVERHLSFLSWTSHLRMVYYDNLDMPTWTLEHPYTCPFKAVLAGLPTAENLDLVENISWTEKGVTKQDFDWVELESSLQWNLFRQIVELLRERDNNVFVLVGPFNEHILKTKSFNVYQEMKCKIEKWLQQNKAAYYIPPPLPSEFYRDASHPIAEGYALLAKQLYENQSFRSSIIP
ncbi:MAG: hypothetical protein JXM79_12315 [Sedimentisphaerales bacterium]|nr:hypothetical protein [Sedimentisphaerales bacterium]